MRQWLPVIASFVCVIATGIIVSSQQHCASAMSDFDTSDTLFIRGLGDFEAQRGYDGLYCFSRDHSFKEENVSLIIYPNDDGTWPSESQRCELLTRYQAFESSVQLTLEQLPSKLKPLCDSYQINIDHLSPSQIITGLDWHNVKLESNGAIECYTMNKLISESLDIVIRFSSPSKISEVYFDG